LERKNSNLSNISPLDGRYAGKLGNFNDFVSEAALICYRTRVEAAWLLHLARDKDVGADIELSRACQALLEEILSGTKELSPEVVKEFEQTTNHDVKAVEYYLRDLLKEAGASDKELAFLHFACTSEDINNLSYGMMLNEVRCSHVLPAMRSLIDAINSLATKYSDLPMLSRTHGQSASPTTLGKEMAVFSWRLHRQRTFLSSVQLEAKMSGAVGHYNAHAVAYPEVDWVEVSRLFIEDRIGLKQNQITTQIESHDSTIEYLDSIRRFNSILLGFSRDVWSYISIGYFSQKTKAGEVGSSTMPHKVNPIDFENAEGQLGIASGLLNHFADKLLISRWQRDLSDSTVLRNIGVALGHSMLAYQSVMKGLDKLVVNKGRLSSDLEQSWEVLTEPVQTVMRRRGVVDAYERLKNFSRGQAITKEMLEKLIDSTSELSAQDKKLLKMLTPENYTGLASQMATSTVERITEEQPKK